MADLFGLLDSLIKSAAIPDRVSGAADTVKDAAGKATGVAGDVLGTATGGIKDAAGAINEKTGIGDRIDDVVKNVSGGSDTGELVGKAKDMVAENKLAAGLAAAGVAALVLRSKKGRELSKDAAKIGGAALIAGLAYKAFKNHQDGKPILGSEPDDSAGLDLDLDLDLGGPSEMAFTFPEGETSANNEKAAVLLKAMIGAAAADYTIDVDERGRIMDNIKAQDLGAEVSDFLAAQFAEPAQPVDFKDVAGNPELASQVYTSARITIDPDTQLEIDFLASLAETLELNAYLVANLDAVAANVRG